MSIDHRSGLLGRRGPRYDAGMIRLVGFGVLRGASAQLPGTRVGAALSLVCCLSSLGCGGSEPEAKEPEPVALGEPSDDIDPALIGEAVRGNSMQLQRCYAAASEANPSLQGQVEVRFLVNIDGSIGQAMVASTNLPSHVASCVVNAFYGLKLPERAEPVIAQYPVFFHPG